MATKGNPLKRWRELHGLSQQQLADDTGVDRKTITRLERGQHLPRLEVALVIANRFAIHIEDIWNINPERVDRLLDEVEELRTRDTTFLLNVLGEGYKSDMKRVAETFRKLEAGDTDVPSGAERLMWLAGYAPDPTPRE